MDTFMLLLIMSASAFSLETETIEASIKAGSNEFNCTFKLVRSDITVDLTESKVACSHKKKVKFVDFRLGSSKGTYLLDFVANPSNLTKIELIGPSTPTPSVTTSPSPSLTNCSYGSINGCIKPPQISTSAPPVSTMTSTAAPPVSTISSTASLENCILGSDDICTTTLEISSTTPQRSAMTTTPSIETYTPPIEMSYTTFSPPTISFISSSDNCSLGYTNVCTKPLHDSCPHGMESKCPSGNLYINTNPSTSTCTCLPTVVVEQAISSQISPLGSCFDACVCLPILACSPCSQPSAPDRGQWYCSKKTLGILSCTLECDLGYIHNIGPTTTCSQGIWSLKISSFQCGAAVALITGGIDHRNDMRKESKVETYSPYGLCSQILPDMPVRRKLHSLNLVEDRVILCGGNNGDLMFSKCLDSPTCLQMNMSSYTWSNHSSAPASRYGSSERSCTYLRNHHNGLVHQNSLILLGGMWAKQEDTDEVWDGTSWKTYKSTPYFWTYGACATKLSRDVYIVIGGREGPIAKYPMNKNNQKRVLMYDLKTDRVTRLPDLQIGRIYEACTLVKNSSFTGVLLAGTGHTQLYDLATNSTIRLGFMNIPRYGHTMMVLGQKIVAMGGRKILGGQRSLNSVEEFDLSTHTWALSAYDLKFARHYAAAAPIPGPSHTCCNCLP